MAKSHLILAALAKDAVPQLDFVQAYSLDGDSAGNFDSALLTGTDGNHYVVRQATSAAAELLADTELTALRAISPYRSHFPFAVTNLVGTGRDARGKRVLVYSYVYGEPTDLSRAGSNSPLVGSIANTLAAIHSLPTSVIENAGLPTFSVEDIVKQSVASMDRMAQTGRVSAVLLNRWERAFEDVSLWRFQPSVVHGAIDNNLLSDKTAVTGILGWDHLAISDPAIDFAWIQGSAADDFSYSLILEYDRLRGADANLRSRAQLYAELDHGHYLLHAIAARDADQIEHAVTLLSQLAADAEAGNLPPIGPRPLGVDSVESDDYQTDVVESDLGSAATMVDAGQAIVSDNLFFSPVTDSSYNHNRLFGTGDDATGPIELVDDATAPIQLPKSDLF